MTVCKPYTEETAADFRQLFEERFPSADADILDVFLSNPACTDKRECGQIAYGEDGEIWGILGVLLRHIYAGETRLIVANGVAMAVKKDCDRSFFTDFIRETVRSFGADLFIANTTIPGSRKRLAAAIGTVDGPDSCGIIREHPLRGRFGRLACKLLGKRCERRKESLSEVDGLALTRELEIGDTEFNGFWDRYLAGNEGLVTSRTAEELRWVFAEGLESGARILITARRNGELVGYAFLRRTDESAACWRIADMIALGNDERILEPLIVAAADCLRRHTPADSFQVTGFPDRLRPLLKRHFPGEASFGFNKCVWACLSERAKTLCGDWPTARDGWYGCPYDGDMCLI